MERWCMKLELTFDINPEDTKPRYFGDAEIDYSNRALERIRPNLEALREMPGMAHCSPLQAE